MRLVPPPGLLSGLDTAHGPLRRIFTRARRLGCGLTLLRLDLAAATAGQNGKGGGQPRIAAFLPRLSAELRATDLAWRGRQAAEWFILLEATADASAAIRRWQESARQWGLELRAQQVAFPRGGLTLGALLSALQPEAAEAAGAEAAAAAAPLPAANGRADGG